MENDYHLKEWSKEVRFFPIKQSFSLSQGERGRGEGEGGHLEWHEYDLSKILRGDLDEIACEENKREGLILKYLGSHQLIQELLSFYLYDGRVFGPAFREFGKCLCYSIYTLSIPVPVYCFAKPICLKDWLFYILWAVFTPI